MGNFFDNKNDALVWLVVNGWRQNDDGHWLKGKREAIINVLVEGGPACVVTRKWEG
jgi:hypothetical protein